MYSIKTDLSVDMVRVYWINCFFYADDSKWSRIKTDMFFRKSGDVIMTYSFQSHVLTARFSVSKLATGCNAFPYEYLYYPTVRDIVENEVLYASGVPYRLSDAKVSWIEFYRSLEFDSIGQARDFVSALNNVPKKGKIKHTVYESQPDDEQDEDDMQDNTVSDYTYLKSGDLVKAYVKNDDPRLPEEIREVLPPTVRIEVECKKKAEAKKFIKDCSAEDILKYPALWVSVYNYTLDKLGLGGRIMSESILLKAARRLLIENNPNIRKSTLEKRTIELQKVITGETAEPDRATSGMISMLKNNGICLFCSESVNTLYVRDVIPLELQRNYEILPETAADKKATASKKRFCLYSLERAARPPYYIPAHPAFFLRQ